MPVPVEITFRNMSTSPALEHVVREKVAALEKFSKDFNGCRVTIDAPSTHQHKRGAFHVRIEMSVNGPDLIVSHDPGPREELEDAHLAVRDAFRAAKRQLIEHADMRHNKVKRHTVGEPVPFGL